MYGTRDRHIKTSAGAGTAEQQEELSATCVHSLYTVEFPSVLLHMQQIKLLLSNCFMQQQLMYSLMMDQ
jgi:hypothetical protein